MPACDAGLELGKHLGVQRGDSCGVDTKVFQVGGGGVAFGHGVH